MTVAASGSPADDDDARCIDVDMHDDPELVPMTDELSDLRCSGQIAHLRVTLEPERDGAKRVHGEGNPRPAHDKTLEGATVSERLLKSAAQSPCRLARTRSDLSEVLESERAFRQVPLEPAQRRLLELRRPAFGLEMDELERVLKRPIGQLAGAWKSSSADVLDDQLVQAVPVMAGEFHELRRSLDASPPRSGVLQPGALKAARAGEASGCNERVRASSSPARIYIGDAPTPSVSFAVGTR